MDKHIKCPNCNCDLMTIVKLCHFEDGRMMLPGAEPTPKNTFVAFKCAACGTVFDKNVLYSIDHRLGEESRRIIQEVNKKISISAPPVAENSVAGKSEMEKVKVSLEELEDKIRVIEEQYREAALKLKELIAIKLDTAKKPGRKPKSDEGVDWGK